MGTQRYDGEDVLDFAGPGEWEAWLAEHHADRPRVWLRIAKKGGGATSITIGEALDVALCWGWIDGQRRGLDATHYLQKYSPRRSRSQWSQVNVRKVADLTAAGRMREPGLREVARAKADGRWDAAYVSQREATVPDDLAAALDANPAAAAYFATLGRTDRYLVLLHLMHGTTTPEQRATRLARAVAALAAARLP